MVIVLIERSVFTRPTRHTGQKSRQRSLTNVVSSVGIGSED
jgi:hypothetical protein